MNENFQEIGLCDALKIASELVLLRQETRDRMIVAVFSNGTEIAWVSEGGQPYSDVTPDPNWYPPTVWIRKVKSLVPPK